MGRAWFPSVGIFTFFLFFLLFLEGDCLTCFGGSSCDYSTLLCPGGMSWDGVTIDCNITVTADGGYLQNIVIKDGAILTLTFHETPLVGTQNMFHLSNITTSNEGSIVINVDSPESATYPQAMIVLENVQVENLKVDWRGSVSTPAVILQYGRGIQNLDIFFDGQAQNPLGDCDGVYTEHSCVPRSHFNFRSSDNFTLNALNNANAINFYQWSSCDSEVAGFTNVNINLAGNLIAGNDATGVSFSRDSFEKTDPTVDIFVDATIIGNRSAYGVLQKSNFVTQSPTYIFDGFLEAGAEAIAIDTDLTTGVAKGVTISVSGEIKGNTAIGARLKQNAEINEFDITIKNCSLVGTNDIIILSGVEIEKFSPLIEKFNLIIDNTTKFVGHLSSDSRLRALWIGESDEDSLMKDFKIHLSPSFEVTGVALLTEAINIMDFHSDSNIKNFTEGEIEVFPDLSLVNGLNLSTLSGVYLGRTFQLDNTTIAVHMTPPLDIGVADMLGVNCENEAPLWIRVWNNVELKLFGNYSANNSVIGFLGPRTDFHWNGGSLLISGEFTSSSNDLVGVKLEGGTLENVNIVAKETKMSGEGGTLVKLDKLTIKDVSVFVDSMSEVEGSKAVVVGVKELREIENLDIKFDGYWEDTSDSMAAVMMEGPGNATGVRVEVTGRLKGRNGIDLKFQGTWSDVDLYFFGNWVGTPYTAISQSVSFEAESALNINNLNVEVTPKQNSVIRKGLTFLSTSPTTISNSSILVDFDSLANYSGIPNGIDINVEESMTLYSTTIDSQTGDFVLITRGANFTAKDSVLTATGRGKLNWSSDSSSETYLCESQILDFGENGGDFASLEGSGVIVASNFYSSLLNISNSWEVYYSDFQSEEMGSVNFASDECSYYNFGLLSPTPCSPLPIGGCSTNSSICGLAPLTNCHIPQCYFNVTSYREMSDVTVGGLGCQVLEIHGDEEVEWKNVEFIAGQEIRFISTNIKFTDSSDVNLTVSPFRLDSRSSSILFTQDGDFSGANVHINVRVSMPSSGETYTNCPDEYSMLEIDNFSMENVVFEGLLESDISCPTKYAALVRISNFESKNSFTLDLSYKGRMEAKETRIVDIRQSNFTTLTTDFNPNLDLNLYSTPLSNFRGILMENVQIQIFDNSRMVLDSLNVTLSGFSDESVRGFDFGEVVIGVMKDIAIEIKGGDVVGGDFQAVKFHDSKVNEIRDVSFRVDGDMKSTGSIAALQFQRFKSSNMANVLFSMNGDITSGDGGSVVDFLTFNSMSPAGNFNISLYYEGDYQNTNDGVVFLFSDNCFQDFDEVQIDAQIQMTMNSTKGAYGALFLGPFSDQPTAFLNFDFSGSLLSNSVGQLNYSAWIAAENFEMKLGKGKIAINGGVTGPMDVYGVLLKEMGPWSDLEVAVDGDFVGGRRVVGVELGVDSGLLNMGGPIVADDVFVRGNGQGEEVYGIYVGGGGLKLDDMTFKADVNYSGSRGGGICFDNIEVFSLEDVSVELAGRIITTATTTGITLPFSSSSVSFSSLNVRQDAYVEGVEATGIDIFLANMTFRFLDLACTGAIQGTDAAVGVKLLLEEIVLSDSIASMTGDVVGGKLNVGMEAKMTGEKVEMNDGLFTLKSYQSSMGSIVQGIIFDFDIKNQFILRNAGVFVEAKGAKSEGIVMTGEVLGEIIWENSAVGVTGSDSGFLFFNDVNFGNGRWHKSLFSSESGVFMEGEMKGVFNEVRFLADQGEMNLNGVDFGGSEMCNVTFESERTLSTNGSFYEVALISSTFDAKDDFVSNNFLEGGVVYGGEMSGIETFQVFAPDVCFVFFDGTTELFFRGNCSRPFDCWEIPPTPSPSPSPSPAPSPYPPSPSPSPSPSPTPTPSPSPSPSPTPSSSPTPIPSSSPTPIPSPSPTPTPSPSPNLSPSPSPTPSPSSSPSPSPSSSPTPSPFPSPFPSPIPSPTPSPTPSPIFECSVEFSIDSDINPYLPIYLSASTNCGNGGYVWEFIERFDGGIISEGRFCQGENPRGRCAGTEIEIDSTSFFFNTTVTITLTFLPDNTKRDAPPPTSSNIIFPLQPTSSFLFVGSQRNILNLEAAFINRNYFADVVYIWGCEPVEDGCPYCPSDSDVEEKVYYYTDVSELDLGFEDLDEACDYNLEVETVFKTAIFEQSLTESITVTMSPDFSLPLVQFDPIISSCQLEETSGELYLFLKPIQNLEDGFEVVDVEWTQRLGPSLSCSNSSNPNCGGDGNFFMYFPQEDVIPCTPYLWEVDVRISNGDSTYNSAVQFCEMEILPPPQGEECELVYDSDCPDPFEQVNVVCRDWNLPCNITNEITIQLFEDEGLTVPISDQQKGLTSNFFVPIETEYKIYIQLCNLGVCTSPPSLSLSSCSLLPSEDSSLFENALKETDMFLDEQNLGEGVRLLSALSLSVGCGDDFEGVVLMTQKYIDAYLVAADQNATNLPDTSTIMSIIAELAQKDCGPLTTLFNSLTQLCVAPTSPDVQTFALNNLLSGLISSSANKNLGFVDQAIVINECLQPVVIEEVCGVSDPNVFEGDAFFYSQSIRTIKQLSEGVTLQAPNATLYLPKNFDQQIAHDYQDLTQDPFIRYSCVAINILRTNSILATDAPISSAVFGVTFFVSVNDTTIEIPVGHRGKKAEDVIIELRREEKVDTDKRKSSRFVLEEPTDNEEILDCSYYLGDGLLSPQQCTTLSYTKTYVNCTCTHFSNFGLLFGQSSNDNWTPLRIVSLALFCGVWLLLVLFMMIVSVSHEARMFLSVETAVEQRMRVLG